MSDYTVGQIVDRCLNVWLLGTYSAQFNQLAQAVGATDTELSCSLGLGEIGQGSFVAIEDELVYVVERDATNNRLVVARGVRGTERATHAQGESIEINPRFPRFLVRSVMQEELDSWPSNLYKPKTLTVSVASTEGVITIPGETDDGYTIDGVIKLRRASLSFMDSRLRPTNGYEVLGDFEGDGGQIMLAESLCTTTSFAITLACKFLSTAIVDFGDDCDLIDDVGLAPGMCEILELGAAHRLLVGRGSVRLFPEAQGQSRVAQEVGSRDIPAFAQSLLGLRELAAAGQVEKLYSRYGFGGK